MEDNKEKIQEKVLEKTQSDGLGEKPQVEKPKVSYSYAGKEYDDQDFIEFVKQKNLVFRLANKLMGDFDESGKYEIPNETLVTLVGLKKKVVKSEKQTTYLKAECLKSVFYFEIEVGVFSKDQSYAQLYVIERAVRMIGEEAVAIKTPVVFYTDDSDAFFEKKYKQTFNVALKEEDEEEVEGRKKENEELAKALLDNMRLMGIFHERYIAQTRVRDKLYLEKVLKKLAEDPKNAELLKLYEQMIKQLGKKLDPQSKSYYHDLKEILDKVLIQNEVRLDQEFVEYLRKLRKVYVTANTQTVEGFKPPEKETKAKLKKVKLKKGPGAMKFGSYKPAKRRKSKGAAHVSMYYNRAKKSSGGVVFEDGGATKLEKHESKMTEQEILDLYVRNQINYEKDADMGMEGLNDYVNPIKSDDGPGMEEV